MRTLIQRVTRARIFPSRDPDQRLASIQKGLVLLVGIGPKDTPADVARLVAKITRLRIFSDEAGKMNFDARKAEAQFLAVSQFTLYADCAGGHRPSFTRAAGRELAQTLYREFVRELEAQVGPDRVSHGEFGSDLGVELVNDGPVTIWLDTEELP